MINDGYFEDLLKGHYKEDFDALMNKLERVPSDKKEKALSEEILIAEGLMDIGCRAYIEAIVAYLRENPERKVGENVIKLSSYLSEVSNYGNFNFSRDLHAEVTSDERVELVESAGEEDDWVDEEGGLVESAGEEDDSVDEEGGLVESADKEGDYYGVLWDEFNRFNQSGTKIEPSRFEELQDVFKYYLLGGGIGVGETGNDCFILFCELFGSADESVCISFLVSDHISDLRDKYTSENDIFFNSLSVKFQTLAEGFKDKFDRKERMDDNELYFLIRYYAFLSPDPNHVFKIIDHIKGLEDKPKLDFLHSEIWCYFERTCECSEKKPSFDSDNIALLCHNLAYYLPNGDGFDHDSRKDCYILLSNVFNKAEDECLLRFLINATFRDLFDKIYFSEPELEPCYFIEFKRRMLSVWATYKDYPGIKEETSDIKLCILWYVRFDSYPYLIADMLMWVNDLDGDPEVKKSIFDFLCSEIEIKKNTDPGFMSIGSSWFDELLYFNGMSLLTNIVASFSSDDGAIKRDVKAIKRDIKDYKAGLCLLELFSVFFRNEQSLPEEFINKHKVDDDYSFQDHFSENFNFLEQYVELSDGIDPRSIAIGQEFKQLMASVKLNLDEELSLFINKDFINENITLIARMFRGAQRTIQGAFSGSSLKRSFNDVESPTRTEKLAAKKPCQALAAEDQTASLTKTFDDFVLEVNTNPGAIKFGESKADTLVHLFDCLLKFPDNSGDLFHYFGAWLLLMGVNLESFIEDNYLHSLAIERITAADSEVCPDVGFPTGDAHVQLNFLKAVLLVVFCQCEKYNATFKERLITHYDQLKKKILSHSSPERAGFSSGSKVCKEQQPHS